MRIAPIFLILVPLLILVAGCAPRHVEPLPPPPPAAPTSIWTTVDSTAIASEFVEAAAKDAWTSQFRDRNGRAARLAIGEITDRSGKNIAIDDLIAALRSAIQAGGDKLALAEGPADFTLRGSIGASEATENGTPITWFAIDLGTIDTNGNPVWPFAKERPVSGR